ncbi:Hsp20/alpha crystallin family protein [Methylogaea oryzae]|uniref:Heat-shock protein n=1 Tax=Methylogaea oryzae TaxID=1295382 RepID=A0A8D5AG12_9GAMM|nr:Hsp20/alpha crystallin family protein [Methylogaea oryzae]BBL69883.1 heat-shock protein [Methylogaea oryzae]
MTRNEPWSLLHQLQRELERSMEARGGDGSVATAEWTPPVDIKEKADGYVLYADVPGVKPENIEVTMENGILTVKGFRETEAHAAKEGYKRIERVHGAFYRRFSLPDTAHAEGITARCSNGVLEISIPKRAAVQPRKIVIST